MDPTMLPGLLANPNDPNARAQFNRAQGIATGVGPGGAPPAPGMSMSQLQEIYGLLAPNAEDPTAMMGQYVNAAQTQQQIDRANTPMEQMLRIYGKVNPHDWSAESLQAFHNNWLQTGNMQFDVLKPKEGLSSTEEEAILNANNSMQEAQGNAAQISGLISRYTDAVQKGGYTQGLYGAAKTWIDENITGNIDQYDALKKDFTRLQNTGIINNLPPGVASDRDIAIIKKGFPGANADPAYLLSFLRGMQKLEIMDAARHYHTASFLGITKSPERLAQNWNETRNDMYLRALRDAGLEVYEVKDPNITDEQAARMALEKYAPPGSAPTIGPTNTDSQTRNPAIEGMDDAQLDSLSDEPIDNLLKLY